MTLRSILAAGAAIAALAAQPAAAQPLAAGPREPQPCSRDEDTRVRCIPVTRDRVIQLLAQKGATLLIEVPDGERVVAIPTSDQGLIRDRDARPSVRYVVPAASAGAVDDAPPEPSNETTDGNLTVKPRGPTVTLKPHTDLDPQPLFVVTENAEGKQTRYRFELRTVPAGQAYYSVRLQNVAAEQAAAAAHRAAFAAGRREAQARDRLAQVQAAPCASLPNVNVRYVGQGDPSLAPSEVCDDGNNTYLRFPGTRRQPAVWMDGPDGKPALANPITLQDGWVQVPGRSRRVKLIDGTALCLINKGPENAGQATGTRTISPDVVLVPREAGS